MWNKIFTFSRKNALGLCSSIISAIWKNKLPCFSSSNPCLRPRLFFLLTPAIEKGWQGKPPKNIKFIRNPLFGLGFCNVSKWYLTKICVISSLCHFIPLRRKTHSPRLRCIAILKPPIPANKSMKVNFGLAGFGNGISCSKPINICNASSATLFVISSSISILPVNLQHIQLPIFLNFYF